MPKSRIDYPETLKLRVSPEDVAGLRNAAQRRGLSVSELVRDTFRPVIAAEQDKSDLRAPPYPALDASLPAAVDELVLSGAISREALEQLVAERYELALDDCASVKLNQITGTRRVPGPLSAREREWEARNAWWWAIWLVEEYPQTTARHEYVERQHDRWRRRLADTKSRVSPSRLSVGGTKPGQSRPRTRRKSSSRRRARAPADADPSRPSDADRSLAGRRLIRERGDPIAEAERQGREERGP